MDYFNFTEKPKIDTDLKIFLDYILLLIFLVIMQDNDKIASARAYLTKKGKYWYLHVHHDNGEKTTKYVGKLTKNEVTSIQKRLKEFRDKKNEKKKKDRIRNLLGIDV